MSAPRNGRWRRRRARLWRWEFWPWWAFYVPVYPYWLVLALRARAGGFFTAANPVMANGGLFGYSKGAVLRHFPATLRPRTFAFRSDALTASQLRAQMERLQLPYPVVLKPDVGERGAGVARVDNDDALSAYLAAARRPPHTLLLQPFVDLPLEFGVMYQRYPGASGGRVTSVVRKETLRLRGDGRQTLGRLVEQHPRAWLYYDFFRRSLAPRWHTVPAAGAAVALGHLGNHCRGATFFDANHLISPALSRTFDQISRHVDGFHFGRYDVKVTSVAELLAGRVQIIELNGANSEPAHIYDPRMPLWRAYLHLFRHWRALGRISRAQHARGVAYLPLAVLWRRLLAHLRGKRPAPPGTAPILLRSATLTEL